MIGVMQVTICSNVASRNAPSSRLTALTSEERVTRDYGTDEQNESEMMCHFEEKYMQPHLAKPQPYILFAFVVLNL
jgi:hypothetical protein